VFDLYPRHSHRTPQQIAEDTGGTFEPTRPFRRLDDQTSSSSSTRGAVIHAAVAAVSASELEPDGNEDAAHPR
jgi:hypothetical protein